MTGKEPLKLHIKFNCCDNKSLELEPKSHETICTSCGTVDLSSALFSPQPEWSPDFIKVSKGFFRGASNGRARFEQRMVAPLESKIKRTTKELLLEYLTVLKLPKLEYAEKILSRFTRVYSSGRNSHPKADPRTGPSSITHDSSLNESKKVSVVTPCGTKAMVLIALVYISIREKRLAIPATLICSIFRKDRGSFFRSVLKVSKALEIQLAPVCANEFISQLVMAYCDSEVSAGNTLTDSGELLSFAMTILKISESKMSHVKPSLIAVAAVLCFIEAQSARFVSKEVLIRLCVIVCVSEVMAVLSLRDIRKMLTGFWSEYHSSATGLDGILMDIKLKKGRYFCRELYEVMRVLVIA